MKIFYAVFQFTGVSGCFSGIPKFQTVFNGKPSMLYNFYSYTGIPI